MNTRPVPLAEIRADTRAQPREDINVDQSTEYGMRMREGDAFPPLVVFREGEVYWLADGFHRFYAAQSLGLAEFQCEIREEFEGELGLRAAILFSCGTNATHGLPRANEDKRRAVLKLFDDPKWTGWSNVQIAKLCAVSEAYVRKLRPDITSHVRSDSDSRTYRDRWGNESQMRTGGIGGSRSPPIERREQSWSLADVTPAPRPSSETERLIGLGMEPQAAEQFAQDRANSDISFNLHEIDRLINELPSPEEAAARFPTGHRYTFTAEKLRSMACWMSAFAEAWAAITEGESRVAAE